MWPLIIPPIVLVLSLGFLVWFLSKKRADPAVEAQLLVLDGQASKQVWFSLWSHEWFLKLLERCSQRLKLFSLKLHNRFQAFSNWLKEKREAGKRSEILATTDGEGLSLASEDRERFWDRWHRRHRAEAETISGESAVPPLPRVLDSSSEKVPVEVVPSTEPTYASPSFSGFKRHVRALTSSESGEATPFFSRTKRNTTASPKKLLSEEELIDRIAKNPKDATSYEELGDYYLSTDNLEDAKACYRQVIKLSPLNREVKDKVRKLERLLVQKEKQRG